MCPPNPRIVDLSPFFQIIVATVSTSFFPSSVAYLGLHRCSSCYKKQLKWQPHREWPTQQQAIGSFLRLAVKVPWNHTLCNCQRGFNHEPVSFKNILFYILHFSHFQHCSLRRSLTPFKYCFKLFQSNMFHYVYEKAFFLFH